MTVSRYFNRRFFLTIITCDSSCGTGMDLTDRHGFSRGLPCQSLFFHSVNKGLYFFHICRHRKSCLVVRTYHLSACIIEEIHLCWLQLLWVPSLVWSRAWIPPLPPSFWTFAKIHFICHLYFLFYAACSLHLSPGNSVIYADHTPITDEAVTTTS